MTDLNLKEKIILATLKDLEHLDISEISLRKISKQLNVTAQAPYHYFPNKDALLQEIKLRAYQELNIIWSKINEDEFDPVTRFNNFGKSYAKFFYNNVGYFKVMRQKVELKPDIKSEILKSSQTFIKTAQDVIDHLNLKDINAEQLTLISWSCIHGLIDLKLQNLISTKEMRSSDVSIDCISEMVINKMSVMAKSLASEQN